MFILERIIGVVAPYDCLACGLEGTILCTACQLSEVLPVPSRCYHCKALASDFEVCAKCRRRTVLKRVWIRSEYDGVAKELARALKFRRARAAAKVMAQLMADNLPVLPDDLVFVSVPTATSRVRQRGYDQAVLLGKELAHLVDKPFVIALHRVGQSRQVGASRQDRLRQLEKAFYASNQQKIKGRTVCLVDDITTTGTTIEIAAKTLKQAGAKKVYAALFAQKV